MASDPDEPMRRDDDYDRHLAILAALPPETRDVIYAVTVEIARAHEVLDSESSPATSE